MSKRMKTFLMICGIVVGVGLILSILGFALGGIKGLSGVEQRVPWVSFGGGQEKAQNFSTGKFSSIDIDCDMGKVEFVEAKDYGVEVSYDKKMGAPKVKSENDTLTVRPSGKHHGWFGFNIFNFGGYANTNITIYYPKGTGFNNVKLNNDMGDMKLNNIKTQILDLSASAGDINLNKVEAGKLTIEADMGDVDATNIKSGGADIDISAGDLTLSGSYAGTTTVSCDMGSCTLGTDLPKESYSIEAKTDMGDCKIDGADVGNHHTVTNTAAKNYLKLDCSAGDLEVNFR